MAAFAVGMVPQLPGLAYQINPMIQGVSRNYVDFTSLGWLEGLLFSAWALTFKFHYTDRRTDWETQISVLHTMLSVPFPNANG